MRPPCMDEATEPSWVVGCMTTQPLVASLSNCPLHFGILWRKLRAWGKRPRNEGSECSARLLGAHVRVSKPTNGAPACSLDLFRCHTADESSMNDDAPHGCKM